MGGGLFSQNAPKNLIYLGKCNSKLINHFTADINECEPSNDCMQKCINTDGSYNCSCDEFFKPDPADWRNCLGESDISDNIF